MDTKTTAKDFFLYLGSIITLYISSGALITLLFQTINFAFPDALTISRYSFPEYNGPIRWSIAVLIIIVPLYFLLNSYIGKEIAKFPAKLSLSVRKALLMFTLFISGATVAGDLIVLVNSFLGGVDITARFVLKVFVVLVVAGGIFAYYIWNLRRDQSSRVPGEISKVSLVSGVIAGVFALVSIIYAFTIIGSPANARKARFDERRSNDLSSIQSQIVNYWQRKEKLPSDLRDIEDPISGFRVPFGPSSGEVYSYSLKDSLTFELCANFDLSTLAVKGVAKSLAIPYREAGYSDFYSHGAGKVCFEKKIDKELYPVYKNPSKF